MRLNREMGRHISDRACAVEELTAELSAAVIGSELGISAATRDDHAAYLAHWVQILREDPKHLWVIAGAAEQAADYLTGPAAEPLAAPTEPTGPHAEAAIPPPQPAGEPTNAPPNPSEAQGDPAGNAVSKARTAITHLARRVPDDDRIFQTTPGLQLETALPG